MKGIDYFSRPLSAVGYTQFFVSTGTHIRLAMDFCSYLEVLEPKGFSKEDLFVDFGSGPGTTMGIFNACLNVSNCILVDGSRDMLSFAEEVFQSTTTIKHLRTVLANLEHDSVGVDSATAKVCSCVSTAMYLERLENIFKEAARILKPGGYFAADIEVHREPRIFTSLKYFRHNDVELFVHHEQAVFLLTQKYGFQTAGVHFILYPVIPNVEVRTGLFVFKKKE